MNILLVNDDGFDSTFLAQLCMAAANRGHHVTVCAPHTQQSAKSHAFTISRPLYLHERSMEGAAYACSVEGTPVDCARLGIMCLTSPKPDLVISGINYGYNTGLATFVSGTVGAAREAAFQGVPAMAVSTEPYAPEETVQLLADWAVRLGERLIRFDAPAQSVCNVNAPPIAPDSIRPAVMCGITRHIYRDSYVERLSPRGDRYYWLTPEVQDDTPTPGSDLDWLQKGHITVTLLTPEGCRQEDYAALLEGMD